MSKELQAREIMPTQFIDGNSHNIDWSYHNK